MRFFSLAFAALATVASYVTAQENPIIFPGTGDSLSAGKPYSITWKPTTQGSVTLTLRYGPSRNLASGGEIAIGVPNNGAFSWTVPGDIGNGDWSIEIKDSAGNTNYSPMFTVSGGTGTQGAAGSQSAKATTAASTTGSSTMTMTTSSTGTSSSGSTTGTSSSRSSTSSTSRSTSATAGSSVPTTGAGVKAANLVNLPGAIAVGALIVLV